MTTITKADLIERMNQTFYEMGDPRPKHEVKRDLTTFLDCLKEYVIEGYHIRFKKVGWLGGKFKKGGRPVRNPKTGEEQAMYDTYSIKLTPHLSKNHKRLNASDIPVVMEKHGLSPAVAEIAYKLFVDAIKTDVIENGGRIELRGLGSFRTRHLNPRVARNPRTGEQVDLDDRDVVAFKAGRMMVREMNKRMGIA